MSPVREHPRKVAASGAALALILAVSTPLIAAHEGEVRATYRDPLGIATSCYGHTGPELRMGQTFTRQQCLATLDADQKKILAGVAGCTKAPLAVDTWAAFLSFSFNAGYGAYCKRFAPLVNAGDVAGACRKLSLYVYGHKNGQAVKLPGLVKRRATERALCEKGLAP